MDNIVSVIVPIYNTEKYLDKCLESIINQSYKKLDIVLVNDGSTDASVEVCKKYAKMDKRIRLFNKENGGLSDAKNYGIKKATGQLITFVDSDDWIEPDMYEKMVGILQSAPCDIVICGRIIEYENGKTEKWYHPQKMTMSSKEAIIKLNSFYNFDMSSCDKLYRKELFKGIEFPVGKKSEDAYETYKLFAKSKTIIYTPDCFYHYFQRQSSISRNNSINMDYVYAAKEQMSFIHESYPEIKNVGETNVAYSVKALFEEAIVHRKKITNELKRERKEARKYIHNIYNNEYISIKKKIIYSMYAFLLPIYIMMIKIKFRGK